MVRCMCVAGRGAAPGLHLDKSYGFRCKMEMDEGIKLCDVCREGVVQKAMGMALPSTVPFALAEASRRHPNLFLATPTHPSGNG